jgi:hypothetical protein
MIAVRIISTQRARSVEGCAMQPAMSLASIASTLKKAKAATSVQRNTEGLY